MANKHTQLVIVGWLVLTAAVIVPLLKAQRVFAARTATAITGSAARPSLRRRAGGRRTDKDRQSTAARAEVAAQACPGARRGARARRDAETCASALSVHRIGDNATCAVAAQAATPDRAHGDAGGHDDCLPGRAVGTDARPQSRTIAGFSPQPVLTSRGVADVPAPPPKYRTC